MLSKFYVTIIRWFTDGERRYGKALWTLVSVFLKAEQDVHAHNDEVQNSVL